MALSESSSDENTDSVLAMDVADASTDSASGVAVIDLQLAKQDTPFHRKLFVELKLQEQEDFLAAVRERRLAAAIKFEKAKADKAAAAANTMFDKSEKLRERIEARSHKLIDMLSKFEDDVGKYSAMAHLLGQGVEYESE